MSESRTRLVLAIPEQLLLGAASLTVPKGTIILKPHQPSDSLYIIVSGHVRLYSLDSRDEKVVHSFYGIDDYFPLGQAISGNASGIHFQAITEVVLRKIPMKDFRSVLDVNIDLCRSVLDYVFEQTAQFKYQVDNLTYKFASERIAYRLLLMGGRSGDRTEDGLRLPSFSQKDFADTIGLSREIVSKGLKKLERLGILRYEEDRMVICHLGLLLEQLKGKSNLPPFFYTLEND